MVSDGVLAEIKMVKDEKPIRYFDVKNSQVVEIEKKDVGFEDGLEKFSSDL